MPTLEFDCSQYDSLANALDHACDQFSQYIALIEVDREHETCRYTYQSYREEVMRFATLLNHLGLTNNQRFAVIMQNQSKWLISAFAGFRLGGILVPIDYKLNAAEQLALLKHANPTILITEFHLWQALCDLAPDLTKTIQVIVSDIPESIVLEKVKSFDQPIIPQKLWSVRQRDDIACIVYSSGTGGQPKGCILTHGNYLSQAEVLGRLYPGDTNTRYFSILPTNHAIDFMCGFILPFLFGATVVHQRTLRPQYLISTMRQYRITQMALVPLILKTLVQRIKEGIAAKPKWKQKLIYFLIKLNQFLTRKKLCYPLSRYLLWPIHQQFGGYLKQIYVGGAFVDKESADFFYAIGIPAIIGYGLTEAGTVVTVNELNHMRTDTVGKPVQGTQIKLHQVDEMGVGEIYVCGPTVMKGYLDAPELNSAIFQEGWLRTGDLGKLESDGHLKIVGRSKNMIVTEGGKNIYPEDIEAQFINLTYCEEYAVFAKNYIWPAQTMGKEKLIIVLHPKENIDLSKFILELNQYNYQLADYKRIHEYLLWDQAFPRTASLKLKRDVLAKAINQKLKPDSAVSL